MSLTSTDRENIDYLFSITQEIFNYYCELILLKNNKKVQECELSTILSKINEWDNYEKNAFLALADSREKINLVMENIILTQNLHNPYLSRRLLRKFDQRLELLTLIELLKMKKKIQIEMDEHYNYYCSKSRKFIDQHYNQAILDDIFNIATYYINNEIISNSNNYVAEHLIDFKYKYMFLFSNNNKHIMDDYNANSVELSGDAFFNSLCELLNIKYIDIGNELFKSYFIQKQLFCYAESLLKINNSSITNDDVMMDAIIAKMYIQACMCLLDDSTKKSIVEFLKNQEGNSISKEILMSALENKDKPIIKTSKQKLKWLSRK